MTPCREILTNIRAIDEIFTFGDQGQLQARAIEDMQILVAGLDPRTQGTIILKGVRWVTGIPCRIVSSGVIRREGGACRLRNTRKHCHTS